MHAFRREPRGSQVARRPRAAWLACVTALWATLGCEDFGDPVASTPPGTGPSPGEIVFRDTVLPILSNHCAGSFCHRPPVSPPQGPLSLEDDAAFANLVGMPSTEVPGLLRVDPGRPESSYFFLKVSRDTVAVGARMPLNRAPLTSAEIEAIRAWIAGLDSTVASP